jgi:LysM repeat protein
LPDRVHVTVIAGLIGLLAMIIFIGGAINGGGSDATPEITVTQPNAALDFAQTAIPAQQTVLPTATPAATTPLPASATPSPIVVETPGTARPLPARPIDAPITSTIPAQTFTHEVISGDTIYDLAITYETSIDAIMTANGISEFDTIRVGDRLLIPAGGA